MALIGIVGIWYASNVRAHDPGCSNVQASFHDKARGAPTVR